MSTAAIARFVIVAALPMSLLLGCASGGAERWSSAQTEHVNVEGFTYWVSWVREPGLVDLRIFRRLPVAIVGLDPIIDKRRKMEAAMSVARRECGTPRAAVETEVPVNGGNAIDYMRFKCG